MGSICDVSAGFVGGKLNWINPDKVWMTGAATSTASKVLSAVPPILMNQFLTRLARNAMTARMTALTNEMRNIGNCISVCSQDSVV